MIDKIDKLKLKLDLLFKKINNLENENKRLLKKIKTFIFPPFEGQSQFS